MANEFVKNVTDAQFNTEVIQSSTPTIVDFWAEWCAPCRAMAPIFDQLASKYAGKINFAKVNIDENPATPSQFGVRGIPTLIVFKDGKPFETIVGLTPKDKLETSLNKAI